MVRDDLEQALRAVLADLGLEHDGALRLDRPDRPEHGDWTTNAALTLAAAARQPPRQLATAIADRLSADPPRHVAGVEVAGPGFVNFRLHHAWLHDVLSQVVHEGADAYARPDLGNGVPVNVEFVSANPTGPLHVGAGRWAAYGDAVCRLLARCGYVVHREYYLNDRGNQTTLFGQSLLARRRGEVPPEGGYQGDYVADWAADMPDGLDDDGATEWGLDRAVRDARDTLDRLGVNFDTWFSERTLVGSGAIDDALGELRERGAAYDADGAVWLRATDFGLPKDEVLVKTGGEPTYLLSDLAYHSNKFERGYERLIDVWGSDHHGHIARLKAGMQALGHDPDATEILLGQLVTVQRGGTELRMGKRQGDFVELAEVLDEVGPDVARLSFLLQSIDTRQVFDLDTVVANSMENPVYYVQYAHARIWSINRKAEEAGIVRARFGEVDLSPIAHERELDLLRLLADLPDVVADACAARAPHKVSNWVRDLAGRFHGFYHDCRVLGEGVPPEVTQARLWLVESVRVGLAVGLELLGATTPESM